MPTGLRPRVNEAREFLEIAKDFKDPRELIREALSNSWDAGATQAKLLFDLVPVQGRKKKIVVTIEDNGSGMSSLQRPIGSSEIEGFFNLGDSAKPQGSIGSKGHGTKIFYKSRGIRVTTWKDGKRIEARTEVDPWDSLRRGTVPTFCYEEYEDAAGIGTRIVVDGFEAKQSEFANLDDLIQYIGWYTVAGSFGHYFDAKRSMDVLIRPAGGATAITVPFGFRFPENSSDLSGGTESFSHVFPAETLNAGITDDGVPVTVQIVGALLGEARRAVVPHTYENMGLWLAKDFIRVERENKILEQAFGGQYYYRSFLILANCQQFDLTANRNNIRSAQEEYELAVRAIRDWCSKLIDTCEAKSYFERKKDEDAEERRKKDERNQKAREDRALSARSERVNSFKGRSDLVAPGVARPPIKCPQNEAETALLLQAMISSGHGGIDFTIGDYNTARGVDLLVKRADKGIESLWWVELVFSLEKLFAWSHHPDGYHAVVCYELGKVGEHNKFTDGRAAKLSKKAAPGRYTLVSDKDTFEVTS